LYITVGDQCHTHAVHFHYYVQRSCTSVHIYSSKTLQITIHASVIALAARQSHVQRRC